MEILPPLDADAQFFAQHPDRQARIRVVFGSEQEEAFRTLGDHDRSRRRIICWRVPANNPLGKRLNAKVIKIPFLAFASESIEDTDAVLLPLLHDVMVDAAREQNIPMPSMRQ